MRGKRLVIRDAVPAAALRRLARRAPDRAAAARMQAIAGALEGMTRAAAARLAGMERKALRDAGCATSNQEVRRTTPRAWRACTTTRAQAGGRG